MVGLVNDVLPALGPLRVPFAKAWLVQTHLERVPRLANVLVIVQNVPVDTDGSVEEGREARFGQVSMASIGSKRAWAGVAGHGPSESESVRGRRTFLPR